MMEAFTAGGVGMGQRRRCWPLVMEVLAGDIVLATGDVALAAGDGGVCPVTACRSLSRNTSFSVSSIQLIDHNETC